MFLLCVHIPALYHHTQSSEYSCLSSTQEWCQVFTQPATKGNDQNKHKAQLQLSPRETHWQTSNCWVFLHILSIYIYYCTSGRAVQENIQFETGSIGPSVGRANSEAENRIFSCTARPKECDNIVIIMAQHQLLRSTGLTVVRDGNGSVEATSSHSKEEGYSFIG